MPYVNIRITPGATRAQKAELVFVFTETLRRVLGKDPAHTHVVVDEVPEQNWGWSGRLTDDIRGRGPTSSLPGGANGAASVIEAGAVD